MEFSKDNGNAAFQIKAYQNGNLIVNNKSYDFPIVVMPEHLIAPWGPTSFEALKAEHFEILLSYKPQVVLFGSGERLRFLSPKLIASLTDHQIGVEVMSTSAAARTYIVLMAEGRQVAAALFV